MSFETSSLTHLHHPVLDSLNSLLHWRHLNETIPKDVDRVLCVDTVSVLHITKPIVNTYIHVL